MFPSSFQHASLLEKARASAHDDVSDISDSFRDVCSLIGSNSPPFPSNSTSVGGRTSLLSSKLNAAPGNVGVGPSSCVQLSENHRAEVVIVSEPEGTSLQMGGLHPRASLFERPVNMTRAQFAHAEFRHLMRENGVRVLTVREILAHGVEKHVNKRMALEKFAMRALTYTCSDEDFEAIQQSDRYFLSDEYKVEVLSSMSVHQLIETILMNPTVHLAPSYRDTGLTATYSFMPLSNLVYTRDQQITTAKGIVMGRLRSPQRGLEVSLMKFCFEKLGFQVIGEVPEPGFLEGGDFVPHSQDLAFIGIGLRSNMEAVSCLMNNDWLGYRRIAVVRDECDTSQDRMHLDCVFGLLSETCCVCYEDMLGDDSPKKRLVDEFTMARGTRTYEKTREGVEFGAYLADNGINIITIPHQAQLEYACNVLNLGQSRIVSVHPAMARKIVSSPHFSGDVQVIDFSPITSMYGAVHCASQVVKRTM